MTERLTREELEYAKKRHRKSNSRLWCMDDHDSWPCEASRLLAHIEALEQDIALLLPSRVDLLNHP